MFKKFTLLFVLLFSVSFVSFGQDKAPEVKQGWNRGAGLGLDLAQIFQLNPRQGSGQNRIGLGGAANYFANYRMGRLAWDNNLALQLGTQKIGSGILPGLSSDINVPFEKNLDELRLNSKVGYQLKENSKFFISSDFAFLSQLLPTYGNFADPRAPKGAYLSDVFSSNKVISKFLNPGIINFSVGVDYKVNNNFSAYFSPIGLKAILVTDDEIASRQSFSPTSATDTTLVGTGKSVYGNDFTSSTDFKNSFIGVGASLRLLYNNKFLNDRIAFTSNMLLFSNYLKEPQNIDVDWANTIAFNIYKGLNLALTVNAYYDHDVLVQVSNNNGFVGGVNGLGRRLSVTEQLLIKYNIVF